MELWLVCGGRLIAPGSVGAELGPLPATAASSSPARVGKRNLQSDQAALCMTWTMTCN